MINIANFAFIYLHVKLRCMLNHVVDNNPGIQCRLYLIMSSISRTGERNTRGGNEGRALVRNMCDVTGRGRHDDRVVYCHDMLPGIQDGSRPEGYYKV